jgi:hypothetical protein
MARLFISYRRSDSLTATGRIYDRLVEAFGEENIFKDVDALMIGVDFRSVINREIGSSDALLAIIGKHWLNATDETGKRRLDNPNDFVRLEIEFALRRRAMLIVPVLIGGAQMPSADELPPSMHDFAFRHAAQVREDPDFRADMSRLTEQIIKYINQNTPTSQVSVIREALEKSGIPTNAPPPTKPKSVTLTDTDMANPLPPYSVPDTDLVALNPKTGLPFEDPATTPITREDLQRRMIAESRPSTTPKPPSGLQTSGVLPPEQRSNSGVRAPGVRPSPASEISAPASKAAVDPAPTDILPTPTPFRSAPNAFSGDSATTYGDESAYVPPIPYDKSRSLTAQTRRDPVAMSLETDAPSSRQRGTVTLDIRLVLIIIALLLVLTIIVTLIATRS